MMAKMVSLKLTTGIFTVVELSFEKKLYLNLLAAY